MPINGAKHSNATWITDSSSLTYLGQIQFQGTVPVVTVQYAKRVYFQKLKWCVIPTIATMRFFLMTARASVCQSDGKLFWQIVCRGLISYAGNRRNRMNQWPWNNSIVYKNTIQDWMLCFYVFLLSSYYMFYYIVSSYIIEWSMI